MNHQDIQVMGEEVIYELPKFHGLQQDTHHGVYLSVFMSLPWEDRSLSGSSYLIALRLGITRSYRHVG